MATLAVLSAWFLALILSLLCLSLVFVAAMIVSLLAVGMPPTATDKKYFPQIFSVLVLKSDDIVYDLGSGRGDFLLAASEKGPKKCVGYELSALMVMFYFFHPAAARVKDFFRRGRGANNRAPIIIRRQNLFAADLSEATVIYFYLTPKVLPKLSEKLKTGLKRGARILCKGSPLPGWLADKEMVLDEKRNYKLYFYTYA